MLYRSFMQQLCVVGLLMNKKTKTGYLAFGLCVTSALCAQDEPVSIEQVVAGQGVAGNVILLKESESDRLEKENMKKAIRLLAAIGHDLRLAATCGACVGAFSSGVPLSFIHPELGLLGFIGGAVGGAWGGATFILPVSLIFRLGDFRARMD